MSSDANPIQDDSNSPARQRFTQNAATKLEGSSTNTQEQVLWRGGYSAKAMYGTWFASAVATIAGIALLVVFGSSHQLLWPIGGSVILLWWCIAIGTYLYRRFSTHYELTTQRFIHQVGILIRRTDRIEVIDIDDVSYTQGIIQRMLGVGTIKLVGSDRTHPELVLYGIDRVPEISGQIDDVRRAERRRRSLHIEAI